ncbi:MAG: HypC/HybG/HupF family hydrogenase formation chaperone [Bryobacteraceae bacterium]
MCLAIPGKILDTEELNGIRLGRVQFGGITRQTYLDFVPDAQPGDFVLVHVGFAISKLDEAEAARTYELLEQVGLVTDELGPEPEQEPEAEGSQ